VNTDFRVNVDFFTHHKTLKLKKRLGELAVLALLRLWAYASKHKVDGDLSDMTSEDIELAADWAGEDGALVMALIEVGYVDQDDESLKLHDWAEHNPWVVEADDRSDKARFSRLSQVNPTGYNRMKAAGINAISKEDYDRLATAGESSAIIGDRPATAGGPPAPAPSPEEEEKKEDPPPLPPSRGAGVNQESLEEDFRAFRKSYPKEGGETAVRREYLKLRKRGVPHEDLLKAVDLHKARDPAWQKNFPQFVTDPAKWLKDGLWKRTFPEPGTCGQGQSVKNLSPRRKRRRKKRRRRRRRWTRHGQKRKKNWVTRSSRGRRGGAMTWTRRYPQAKGRRPSNRAVGYEADRMNKLEAKYAAHLELLRQAGKIVFWRFESVKFRLANLTWFTPDFYIMRPDGSIEIHETKGFMEDDANVKIKAVAEQFPELLFVLVRWVKGEWEFKRYRWKEDSDKS